MKLWRSGMRLCSRASARASPSDGATGGASAATAKEHPLRVAERALAALEQHREVVENVGGLLVDPVVGLLARGAGDLLGLLLDLLADAGGLVEQLDGVGALGALGGAGAQHPLEVRERLVRCRIHVTAVKARPLAG